MRFMTVFQKLSFTRDLSITRIKSYHLFIIIYKDITMYIGRNLATESTTEEASIFDEIQTMLRVREGIDVPIDLIKASHYEYMANLYRRAHALDLMLTGEAANDEEGVFEQ